MEFQSGVKDRVLVRNSACPDMSDSGRTYLGMPHWFKLVASFLRCIVIRERAPFVASLVQGPPFAERLVLED